MSTQDLFWLAGLLEGEGCFTWSPLRDDKKTPLIQLIMNDYDVVERAAKLMGVRTIGIKKRQPPRQNGFRIRLAGAGACEAMIQLYPLMGARRKTRIKEILDEYYGQAGVEAAARKVEST